MLAGYSQKSLVEKLGIKGGCKILILHAPDNYERVLGILPPDIVVTNRLRGEIDFIQFFTEDSKELQKKFPALKKALAQNGILWISWPKGSSGVSTDLNGNIVRDIGLSHGLVDVKIAAIDETWSGLKFVYRLKDRQKK